MDDHQRFCPRSVYLLPGCRFTCPVGALLGRRFRGRSAEQIRSQIRRKQIEACETKASLSLPADSPGLRPCAESDKLASLLERDTIMEQAAALLVQTIFSSDERMLSLLKGQTALSPQAVAEFVRPWYQAMLMMIKSAEAFDQGPSLRPPAV
jgi:hypothetical protein